MELAKAVSAAVNLTKEEDTLILVTADHSHVMSLNGYARRGNNILGLLRSFQKKFDFRFIEMKCFRAGRRRFGRGTLPYVELRQRSGLRQTRPIRNETKLEKREYG